MTVSLCELPSAKRAYALGERVIGVHPCDMDPIEHDPVATRVVEWHVQRRPSSMGVKLAVACESDVLEERKDSSHASVTNASRSLSLHVKRPKVVLRAVWIIHSGDVHGGARIKSVPGCNIIVLCPFQPYLQPAGPGDPRRPADA